MMARYIDADKLREYWLENGVNENIYNTNNVLGSIDYQPTAEVAEVKRGEWKLTKTEFGWNGCEYPAEYTCSVCGRVEAREEPYCHYGAKMDGIAVQEDCFCSQAERKM